VHRHTCRAQLSVSGSQFQTIACAEIPGKKSVVVRCTLFILMCFFGMVNSSSCRHRGEQKLQSFSRLGALGFLARAFASSRNACIAATQSVVFRSFLTVGVSHTSPHAAHTRLSHRGQFEMAQQYFSEPARAQLLINIGRPLVHLRRRPNYHRQPQFISESRACLTSARCDGKSNGP